MPGTFMINVFANVDVRLVCDYPPKQICIACQGFAFRNHEAGLYKNRPCIHSFIHASCEKLRVAGLAELADRKWGVYRNYIGA